MRELIKKMITGDLTAVVFLPPQVSQKPPREGIHLGLTVTKDLKHTKEKTSAEI